MSTQQCWAVKDGHRCAEPVTNGNRFCAEHSHSAAPATPLTRYREAEAPSGAHPNPAPPTSGDQPSLGWLLGMLQEAMSGVMAGDIAPIQKANALSRLGNLYLKAYRAAQLQQENRTLRERAEALEEANAVLAQRCAELERWPAATDQQSPATRSTLPDKPTAGTREPAVTAARRGSPTRAARAAHGDRVEPRPQRTRAPDEARSRELAAV
jgi:hypothetical protein